MARKRKKKRIVASKRAYQKTQRPSNRLQDALTALAENSLDSALSLSTRVLHVAKDKPTQEKAEDIASEALFRIAASTPDLNKRLDLLNLATEYTPDDLRLHYHQGVTLCLLGKMDEAGVAFDHDAIQKSAQKLESIHYLRQLTSLANGSQWAGTALSATESNTLRLIQQLTESAEAAESSIVKIEENAVVIGRSELWQALIQMQNKPKSAPIALLNYGKEGNSDAGLDKRSRSAVVDYYRGIAAMRKGERADAQTAWQEATQKGLSSPWFEKNLAHLLREEAVQTAQEGQWQFVIDLCKQHPNPSSDKVLVETLGTALYHLGYEAAQAGRWHLALKHWREASEHINSRQLSQNLALAEEELEHWSQAAEAWREMIRRRPRKEDHPDYLTDEQVAAIWRHIAECYQHDELKEEAINCLKNAIKYAPNDVEHRLNLVDLYLYQKREESAGNEVNRILAIDADNVPTLMRLAAIQSQQWQGDASSVWRRILKIEPDNQDAKDALATHYLGQVQGSHDANPFQLFMAYHRSVEEKIEILEKGIEVLPGYPMLLAMLGKLYVETTSYEEASKHLIEAWDAAPGNLDVIDIAMHELIDAEQGEVVLERWDSVGNIHGLLANFWIEQGSRALRADFDAIWVERFWDEAIVQSEKRVGDDSKALALLFIFQAAYEGEEPELANLYEARIRQEVPKSGAVEFIEAYRFQHEDGNSGRAFQRLRKAKRLAEKAGETGIMNFAAQIEMMMSNRGIGASLNQLDPSESREFNV